MGTVLQTLKGSSETGDLADALETLRGFKPSKVRLKHV